MIRGRFNEHGQATVSGLVTFRLRFEGRGIEIPVEFVIDTGSDVTTLVRSDYEPFAFSDFGQQEVDADGYGGSMIVKRVPLESLQFRLQRGGFGSVHLESVDVIKPDDEAEGLPSVVGRDLIDQYRLVIDKSANLVLLQNPTGPTP